MPSWPPGPTQAVDALDVAKELCVGDVALSHDVSEESVSYAYRRPGSTARRGLSEQMLGGQFNQVAALLNQILSTLPAA